MACCPLCLLFGGGGGEGLGQGLYIRPLYLVFYRVKQYPMALVDIGRVAISATYQDTLLWTYYYF